MTQVTCCKCSAKYDLRLFKAIGFKLPVTQCPNCGVVHSLKFDTVDVIPTKRIKDVKLLAYYYSDVSQDASGNEGAIGSNANPPAKLGVALTDYVKTNKFWVGVALCELGCNKTVDTSQNVSLYWRKNGGSWNLLSSSGELKYAGTGQMAYTDLSPPAANAWVAQNNACALGLEPGDQVAQDNSGTLATGTGTGDRTKEFWWAIDPSGAADGALYEFALRDAQAQIGGAGTEYLLDCSITTESFVKTVTDKGAGQDSAYVAAKRVAVSDVGIGVEPEAPLILDGSFPDAWGRKCVITIKGNINSSTAQTNFAVLLTQDTLPSELLDSDTGNNAQNGGGDLRVYDGDYSASNPADENDNRLPLEVVDCTVVSGAGGTAHLWVRVPTVGGGTTPDDDVTITIFYNATGKSQPAKNHPYGTYAVWPKHKNVYHLITDPSTTPTPNSAGNYDNASGVNLDADDLVTGPIDGGTEGKGWEGDGSPEYVTLGDSTALDGMTVLTISCWIYPNALSDWAAIIRKLDDVNAGYFFHLSGAGYQGNNDLRGGVTDGTNWFGEDSSADIISTGSWQHVAMIWHGGQSLDLYKSGVALSKVNRYNDVVSSVGHDDEHATFLCQYLGGSPTSFFNARIAEVRMTNQDLGVEWLLAEYRNANAPATYVVAGTPADVTEAGMISVSDKVAGQDSLYNLMASMLAASDLGAGQDLLSGLAARIGFILDYGYGSDSALVAMVVKAVTDAGVGADVLAGLAASLQATDSGTGVDSFSGLAASTQLTDSGIGIDSAGIALIVQPILDAGIGVDVLAGLAASLQATDAATGTDTPSVRVSISIIDQGTGQEVTSIQVLLQTTDVGVGLDLATTMLQLSVADKGTGQDSLAGLSVGTQIEDDAVGIDSISGLSVDVQVTDDGTGIDSVSLALTISVSDAATGIDSISVAATIIITVLDALVGIDSFAGLSASTQIQDSSVVQDLLAALAASIAISDLGVGTDSVTKSVEAIIKMVTDLGVGTDVLAGLATSLQVEDAGTAVDELRGLVVSLLAAEDVGVGLDSVSIISYIVKTISDTAIGYDVLAGLAKQLAVEDSSGVIDFLAGLAVDLQITDSSEVADTIARSVLASILDQAIGVDSFRGISVQTQAQDRGAGISSVSGISISLQVTDFFTASDIVTTLALIVKTVTDSGAGVDSLAGVSFNISVEDAVQGADLVYQLQAALSVMDIGVGIEALVLDKQVQIAFVGITIIQKTASRTTGIVRTACRVTQVYRTASRLW